MTPKSASLSALSAKSAVNNPPTDEPQAPVDSEGGPSKLYQLFREAMDPLIAGLNEALVA